MSCTQLSLELHVPDFAVALMFYERLGFAVHRREENYLVLKSNEQVLCLYGGTPDVSTHSYFGRYGKDTKRGYGIEVMIFVSDLDEALHNLRNVGEVISPPQFRAWGVRDFRMEDPFGYYLRISEPYDLLAPL